MEIVRKEVQIDVLQEIERLTLANITYDEAASQFKRFLAPISKRHNNHAPKIINQILLSLRKGKAAANNASILDFLEVYRISMISHRRKGTSEQIKDASQGKASLDPVALNEIALTQNRARGKTFELMESRLLNITCANLRTMKDQ
jgi:hypothetical protein